VQIRLSHFFYEVEWPVILMEVCELGSLEDLVAAYRAKGEDIPESLVAIVLLHLAQALNELHSRNVLHRDVKASPNPVRMNEMRRDEPPAADGPPW
jgi:serine/threonine protein kinase